MEQYQREESFKGCQYLAKLLKLTRCSCQTRRAGKEADQALKFVLERAKTYNVPKAIIDRAIEKAKGGRELQRRNAYEGFQQRL